jgi:DNA-dependent RNA polymerase auxiliary subunit epsilon
MSKSKLFHCDYEYSFWFFKTKFEWILEMIGLMVDYPFAEEELIGMELSLADTKDEDPNKWSGGLYYGNTGSLYINMALDTENRDLVHIRISTTKQFQAQIEFIDKLQCNYEGFHKFKTY